MDLKRLDKEEAKKLKTKFNNYRKVISWKEVLNSLENNKRLSLPRRAGLGGSPAERGDQLKGPHADSSQTCPLSRRQDEAGIDSKTIKQTFNKIWLGMPRGNSISDHIKPSIAGASSDAEHHPGHPPLKGAYGGTGHQPGNNTSLRNHPSQNEVVPKGLKVELKGRLRGAAKSKKLSKIRGSVKSQSIDWNIEYNKKEIYTKWGILGLKIWLVK